MWLKVKVNAANKLETVRFCLIVADLATIERTAVSFMQPASICIRFR